jgi:adenylyl- and sulfurtransferase ThiI
VKECGPCHVFASFILEFAFQLRKKHGKTSVRVTEISVRLRETSVIFYKEKTRGVVGHPVGTKFLSLYIMY